MTIDDAYLGGKNEVSWQNLEGSLRIADWTRIGRLSLVADNAAWSDTLVTETLIGSANRAELHLVDVPGEHDARRPRDARGLPAARRRRDPRLDRHRRRSHRDRRRSPRLPDNLLALPADPIRDWQAAGGRIAITEIKGTEGDDTITVTGDLGLNADGLAEGTIEIASKGIAERTTSMLAPEMQPLIFGAPGDDGTQPSAPHDRQRRPLPRNAPSLRLRAVVLGVVAAAMLADEHLFERRRGLVGRRMRAAEVRRPRCPARHR